MRDLIEPQQLAAKLVRTKRDQAADYATRNIQIHHVAADRQIEHYWQDVLTSIHAMQGAVSA